MQVKVRSSPSSTDLCIRTEESYTVLMVRQIIGKEIKVPLDQFYLCYDQEILVDQNTLEDYGLQEGAILHCVIKPASQNFIRVRLDDGTNIKLSYQLSDTVQKIKRIIGEKVYGRRCQLVMFCKGKAMENSKTMKEYEIKGEEEVFAFRAVA